MATDRTSNLRNPSSLSDGELYAELYKCGETVSPLTPSTRSVFERRLASLWKFLPGGYLARNTNKTVTLHNESEMNKSHCIEDHNSTKLSTELPAEVNNLLTDTSISQVYFGVSLLPCSSCSEEDEPPLVFTDKKEALRAVKKYKGARFKAFSNREEAVAFASQSPESLNSSPAPKSPGLSLSLNSPEPNENSGIIGEKPSLFKGPKSQDLVKLRKAVECGDAEYFKQTVWANPRYLVSSGDTPAVLQEGFRYNGLHVAAKSKQPSMCRLILDTIEDPKFMQLLYTDDTEEIRQQRISFITDLYLNMPDKGLCETPLHFASKFGCYKSVEILASHPACITDRSNKYGQKPYEIICDRYPGATAELKKQIEAVFEERYFVPVLRAEYNSSQPVIGEPWSPGKDTTGIPGSPSTPVSPKEPSLAVQAVAGPMAPKQAELFYKQWKTPPRSLLPGTEARKIRLSDPEKGLERIGRDLAQNFKVPWKEYWSFLNSWCDLSSSEGLVKLDDHLKKLYAQLKSQVIPDVKEEAGLLEQITSVADDVNKNSLVDASLSSLSDGGLSPISDLCRRLENFHAQSSSSSDASPEPPSCQNFFRRSWHTTGHLDDVAKTLEFELSPLHSSSNQSRTQFFNRANFSFEKSLNSIKQTNYQKQNVCEEDSKKEVRFSEEVSGEVQGRSECIHEINSKKDVDGEKDAQRLRADTYNSGKELSCRDVQKTESGVDNKHSGKNIQNKFQDSSVYKEENHPCIKDSSTEALSTQNILTTLENKCIYGKKSVENENKIQDVLGKIHDNSECENRKSMSLEVCKNETSSRRNLSNLNILCATVVHSLSTILSDMVISFPNYITHETMTHKYLKDNVLPCIRFLQIAVTDHAVNDCPCVKMIHKTIAKQVLANLKEILIPHEMKLVHRGLSSYLNVNYNLSSSEDEDEECSRQRQKPANSDTTASSKWQHLKCIVQFVCDHLSHPDLFEERICLCVWPLQKSNSVTSSPSLSSMDGETSVLKDSCNLNLLQSEFVQDCNSNIPSEDSDSKVCFPKCQMQLNDRFLTNGSQESLPLSRLDEESGDEQDDVFYTPPSSVCSSSSNPEEVSTPDEGLQVFIQGKEPSKLDLDVYRVIKTTYVDEILYPHVCRWKHLISSFSEEVIESWQGLSKQSSQKHLFHRRSLLSTPASAPSSIDEDKSTPAVVHSRKESTVPHYHTAVLNPKNLYESFLSWEESSGE